MEPNNPLEMDDPAGAGDADLRSVGLRSSETAPEKGKPIFRRLGITIFGIVFVGVLVFSGFYIGSHSNRASLAQKMAGTVVLSEENLKKLIKSQHLTVYWTGAVVGDSYTLFIPKSGVAVVRYLPPESKITDSSTGSRLVATYLLKNAFSLAKKESLKPDNLGFINIDGNAVYYPKTKPTNVVVGLKGLDVQIEIYDPGQGQSVALALFRGQIQKIG